MRYDTSMIGSNTDGIDIVSGQDIFISNCHVKNGDDSIALFARPEFGPTERITIDHRQSRCKGCAASG